LDDCDPLAGSFLPLSDFLQHPLEDTELLGHPETAFVLIIKDGTIYKNTIEKSSTDNDGPELGTRLAEITVPEGGGL